MEGTALFPWLPRLNLHQDLLEARHAARAGMARGHPRNAQSLRLVRYREDSWLGREDSNLRMAESKSAALPLGEAPIPFFPGWRPRRLDHNARRDAPLSFAQRLKIFRFTAGFGGSGGFPSRRIQQWDLILCGSTDGWEREREAIFFALSFFQFLMNGFNADAPSDWL